MDISKYFHKTNKYINSLTDKELTKYLEGIGVKFEDVKIQTDICNTFCCYENCERCIGQHIKRRFALK